MGFYDEENYVPEKLPDAKNKMFEDKIREYLVVTNDYSGAAVGKTAQMDILASVDVQTDEFDSMEGKIIWETTDEELKTGAFFKRFKKGTIYRILARRSKAKPENKYNNMYSLVRVIEDSISDERLESILKEYRKKVVIEDEISGKFVLDKEIEMFEGSIEKKKKKIILYLEIEKNDPETWDNAHENMKRFISELDIRDKEMREFSADSLTDLANDWLEDSVEDDEEEIEEITEEDFAQRIDLCEISVDSEGSYAVYYSDDDMFWGHSIQVCGSFDEGIESAEMVG